MTFELGRGDVPQHGVAALGVVGPKGRDQTTTDVRRELPRRLGAIGLLGQFQLGLRPEKLTTCRSTTP